MNRRLVDNFSPLRDWIASWPMSLALIFFLTPCYIALAQDQWQEENYSHGPAILLVCLWLLWREWPHFSKLPQIQSPLLSIIIFTPSAICFLVGRSLSIPLIEIPGQLGVLLALTWYFKGWLGVRCYWFAFVFMLFLVPIPGSLIYSLTHVLKLNVSIAAEHLLAWLEYPIAREGVMLIIGPYQLLVADACSGMNSIIALGALGLIYLYINPLPYWWQRNTLLLLIIPIAVFANICRVIALIIITFYFGDEAGQGFAHNLAGVMLFICAMLMLFVLDKLLRCVRGEHATPN